MTTMMRRMSHHFVEPPPPLPDPTRDVLVTTVSLPLSRSWIRGDRGNSSWYLDSILWSIGEYFGFFWSYFLHLMTQQQFGVGGYFLEMETLDDMTTTMRRRSYHLVSPPPFLILLAGLGVILIMKKKEKIV